MAYRHHVAKLKEGVDAWNHWRAEGSREYLKHFKPGRAARWESYLGPPNKVHVDLSGAKLAGTNLSGFDFEQAWLDGVDLSGAKLTNANLQASRLEDANLSGADFREADLSRCDATGANCRGADFTGSTALGAKFKFSRLISARFSSADLSGSTFDGAELIMTRFDHANLKHVDFSGAFINEADFGSADLSAAIVGLTTFANTDLSKCVGLETVQHKGPSTIGIDTLGVSRGEIPEIFLRGAGLPDSFIVFTASLIGQAIRFHSCFISYSTRDQEFAERLHADLQDKGVRCWFAPHDIRGGKKLHEQIDEAIQMYDRLLLILSESSMNSEWVKTEIAHARHKELNERRQVLFPITLVPFAKIREWKCFDADTGKDSAREIREYFIPDFNNWKEHNSYEQAFQRLVEDLKAAQRT